MNTVVALSTPRGRGALAVIRLSGPQAIAIAQRLARLDDFEPRRATLTKLRSVADEEVLDQVLLTCFPAPHSLTGEDVVEISCHGSPAIVRRIVDATIELGAVLAAPGEFTLRALTNGKIDLAQAEAIRDLIAAQTDAAVKQAARQLNGELSNALDPFKQELIEVIVLLESALEFVEDDLPEPQLNQLEETLVSVIGGVTRLSQSYSAGRLLRDGARVAITGRPNVGKSSLFNSLVHSERAIVTDVPGTTRDTLSELIDIGGVPVVVTDTAGLRETSDNVERLGVERTHRAMGDADLVVVVLDGSTEVGPEDQELLDRTADTRRIVVLNKSDLPDFRSSSRCLPAVGAINVSARTGAGLANLHSAIVAKLNSDGAEDGSLLITNARHYDLLRNAKRELEVALECLRGRHSEELVLAPLHNALKLLGQITGETTTEDILSEIFATFCIGK
ncbi:MAG: tRNA uridine-5-carboxymethylaminomethyl(34) synthesis GTPase MnmE [Acidobacteria bacterium]|nr:tRNA uridine-5-carboxymethylaminomethyl(34) synthesis GTPase MnmE [Acidobacteriota bacterium]MCA1627721.1 tRNA uridine-5-carboxymethylaminomethyl(34) synthesis GTPase MnmE [Acidobacteriota bacterium]